MPPRTIPPGAPEPPEPAVEPPFYEATEDLWSGGAGAMPVLAYRAGDRVVPDVVGPNGWGGKVRVPDVFAGQLTPAPGPGPDGPEPDPDGPERAAAPPDPEASAPASDTAGEPGAEE